MPGFFWIPEFFVPKPNRNSGFKFLNNFYFSLQSGPAESLVYPDLFEILTFKPKINGN